MIQLTPLEEELREVFSLSDRDARRLNRVMEDLNLSTGLALGEIFDFLRFGAEQEFAILKQDYHWENFRIRIQKKLRPKV